MTARSTVTCMRWGLVTTTNAPTRTVLDFVAYHLDQGASRLWLFLDDCNTETAAALADRREVKCILTDDAYWQKKGRRPVDHQPRQSVNARHAYNRSNRFDWLGHIDIDEFLCPEDDMARALAALPSSALVARIRAVEALAPGPDGATHWFKAMPIDRAERRLKTDALYPEYGRHLFDGFLSHLAGKIFVRTGQKGLKMRIHNAVLDGIENPGQVEMGTVSLCHLHAENWETWRARFDYRLEHGVYRASVARRGPTGMNTHEFFKALLAEGGEEALRAFHTALCTATPDHLAALETHGLLRKHTLQLSTKRKQFFPDMAD
ncbi:glycosyltransferase family 2 protein [Pseudaestuariivita atlantica]|nr:glycosyltransferase family 2 protein [Pseudaestuariivita atlantica]